MAPPTNRRPGFSRKAQYGLFAGYVVAVSGALLGLLLIVTAWIDPSGHNAIRSAITDVTAPISSGLRSIVRSSGESGTAISEYFDAASKNAELRAELTVARRKLIEARVATYENARLKRLLKITENNGDTVATARLISSSSSSTRRYAVIDAGENQGILSGQPVRSADGLIGRIVEAGQNSAHVLLITDTGNVVPVVRINDGLPAIATGMGNGMMDIKSLSAGANIFKRGDVFVTSGTGGVYPPRIPVAIATTASGDGAVGRPLANPTRLDFAIVQPAFLPNAAAPPAPQQLTGSNE